MAFKPVENEIEHLNNFKTPFLRGVSLTKTLSKDIEEN